MSPVKLSAIHGFPRELDILEADMIHSIPFRQGFNRCLSQIGSRSIGLSREKLITFLCKQKGWSRMHVLPEGAEMLADAIISNEDTLIEVKP